MSGFAGFFQRDGQPLDAGRLAAVNDALRFRGPDGTHRWHAGPVGFCHARLTTDPARDGEILPLSLDGRWWLTGHLRLDARGELISALCAAERSDAPRALQDAALVLRAYRAWGPDCVRRLHGDFSFAIWDEPAHRLFCARDRLGVRPFFYTVDAAAFAFSNTLEVLRGLPGVDGVLDELAVADFLVAGHSREPHRSFFAGVRRLPPAHTLVVTAAATTAARYWSPPVEPERRHRDPRAYVEEFADVLGLAVADRTPAGPVALRLSGGLDSGAIAATLAGRLSRQPAHAGAHGFCVGWNSAFADPEPGFARLTADALGLPLSVREEPDCTPLADAATEPEPSYDIFRQVTLDALQPVAAHARVALDGQGGDEAFQREHWLDEWRRRPSAGVVADFLRAWRMTGTRPPLGLRAEPAPPPQVPAWIDVQWRRTLGLDERVRRLGVDAPDPALPRARARARLASPLWQPYFEGHDAGLTRTAVEVRWPLLDERVLRFALSLPPFPWTLDKYLEREALRRCLPAAVTGRPKTALAADPLAVFLRRQPQWGDEHRWIKPWLRGRIDLGAWLHSLQAPTGGDRWAHVRAAGLARWLRRQASPAGTL